MTASPVDDKLLAALAELRARFGEGVLDDRRRVVSLLGDHVPEARREIRLIGLAMDDGVPDELRRAPGDQLPLQVQRLAGRLENQHGLRPDFAHWAVSFWLRALAIPAPLDLATPVGLPQETAPRPTAPPPPPAPSPVPPPPMPPASAGPATLRRFLSPAGIGALVAVLVVGLGTAWLLTGEDPRPPEDPRSRGATVVEQRRPEPQQPQPQPAPRAEAPSPVPSARPQMTQPEAFGTLEPASAQMAETPVSWIPGASLTARFVVPGSPIRYTVTLRADAGTAAWSATDPQGRRARGTGTLVRSAPDGNGNAWDWSRIDWRDENQLGIRPLCLAAFAGRQGAGDPHGGTVCLYDQSCAATYGCLRMKAR